MSAAPATLYSIEDDLIASLDTLELLDPETDAELRAELEEEIARLVAAEITKVDGVVRMLAHFESQAELAGEEIARLSARKKGFESSYERLESCARLAMSCAGKTRLDGKTSALVLRKNPPKVFVSNFDLVPAEYLIVKQEITVDKDAVKRAIKGGAEIPGAELVQGDRLERK